MMTRFLFIISFFIVACSVEPEPLGYGKDVCHTCKMMLMDKKFGAEVVTQKGKVYKFDDVNCMVNFLNAGAIDDRDIAYRLVVDFNSPEKLIDTNHCFFLKSQEIKSPMGSHVAAFETKSDMELFKKKFKGIYLVWGELVTEYK